MQLRLFTGREYRLRGNSGTACGAGGRAQELKHSARQRLSGAGIVFNRFTVFPLISLVLLAQLPFLPLLRRHQRTVLRILGLQGGDQPGLLRQAFCSSAACCRADANWCDSSEL